LQRDMDEDREVDIPFLMGQVAGVIDRVEPAGVIMRDMVRECVDVLRHQQSFISAERSSKL